MRRAAHGHGGRAAEGAARATAGLAAALLAAAFLAATVAAAAQSAKRPAQAAFDPQRAVPAEALREDLEVLWAVLEEGHGGLDRYTPAAELRKGFDDVAKRLTSPLTELELYRRLLPLVAAVKDGHTRLLLSEAAEAHLDSRPVLLPFGLRFLDGRAYVFNDLSAAAAVGAGAELLAVDGAPAAEVLGELLPLVPSDAGIRTRKLRLFESPAVFGRLHALRLGLPESFRVRYRPRGSDGAREATVAGIRAADIGRVMGERYPEAAARRPLYELAFRGEIGVLTVRAFADDPGPGRPRFPEFVAGAFRALEEKKANGLVIDLRGNGGGVDEYAKLLYAHCAERPFLYYWALETKKDRYDLFRRTDETREGAEELARQVRRNARGRFDVVGHPNSGLQQGREPRFAGRVAILIDGGSSSATGEVTSAFHYYRRAVFFGEECGAGYYGNTSGFTVTAALPNTGIRIRVPLVLYAMAVDGYPKDRGLVPDVPVSPTIEDLLAGRDPALERALARLGER